MRIVFIGTVKFSLKALERLVTINSNVVGVCTKESSQFNADFADLTPICKKNSIPFQFINDINSEKSIEWIKELNPDIIFCFGWSSLIRKELLSIPPKGIVGYHPALLPKHRGRHPIIWALALGLKETGSTFFFMNEEVDSGDILSQKKIFIEYKDNAQSLYSKIIKTALSQINEFIPKLKNESYNQITQDETQASYWRKRSKEDGLISFNKTSNEIYNLVRALSRPYNGAHLLYKNNETTIWKVEEVKDIKHKEIAGTIIKVEDNKILVKTADSAINILKHEFVQLPLKGECL